MSFEKLAFIISPLIVFTIYIVLLVTSYNWFIRIGKKTIKRIYYLLALVYFSIGLKVFYPSIISVKLYEKYPFNQIIFNILSFVIAYWIIAYIWDLLFVSCVSINSLAFKDFKITTEDVENIKIAEKVDNKNIEILNRILVTQLQLIIEMSQFVNIIITDIESDDSILYKKFLRKYANIRKDIEIKCYELSDEGLKELGSEHKLDESKLSAIQYSLMYNQVCTPDDTDKDVIYAILSTKACGDLILALSAEYLYKNEHLVIQNLICILDLYLELEYKNHLLTINNIEV